VTALPEPRKQPVSKDDPTLPPDLAELVARLKRTTPDFAEVLAPDLGALNRSGRRRYLLPGSKLPSHIEDVLELVFRARRDPKLSGKHIRGAEEWLDREFGSRVWDPHRSKASKRKAPRVELALQLLRDIYPPDGKAPLSVSLEAATEAVNKQLKKDCQATGTRPFPISRDSVRRARLRLQ
jgi:hypothetical protein